LLERCNQIIGVVTWVDTQRRVIEADHLIVFRRSAFKKSLASFGQTERAKTSACAAEQGSADHALFLDYQGALHDRR
jgi:hypothetical protein